MRGVKERVVGTRVGDRPRSNGSPRFRKARWSKARPSRLALEALVDSLQYRFDLAQMLAPEIEFLYLTG